MYVLLLCKGTAQFHASLPSRDILFMSTCAELQLRGCLDAAEASAREKDKGSSRGPGTHSP